MAVRVITDSTSYIPAPTRERLGIAVVSLGVAFPDTSFREVDVSNEEFYRRMALSSTVPTSTQPSRGEFVEAFSAVLDAGDDIVGVFLLSDMSGTYAGAVSVAEELRGTYPDRSIEVVDSRSNCMELGFAAIAAAEAGASGGDTAACAEAARHVIARSRFLFVPATLDYLRKGGRIGGASALLGSVLQIRPILTVIDGKTEVLRRVRTAERARREIVAQFSADVAEKGPLLHAAVHHIEAPELAEEMAAAVEAVAGKPVERISIGPVIGLHVGPGTVAVVYVTDREMHKEG